MSRILSLVGLLFTLVSSVFGDQIVPERRFCRPNYAITTCQVTPDNCFSDDFCSGTAKCCPFGCGRICQNTTLVQCPRIDQEACPVSKCFRLGGYARDADGCDVCACNKCADDERRKECTIDPCLGARCATHPNARCVPNYCRKCRADFFVDGLRVDCGDKATAAPSTSILNPTCGRNEDFRRCGTACEPTCKIPSPLGCIQQCTVNVCQCRSGYVRSSNGQCIRPETCPSNRPNPPPSCAPNEKFRRCGTACEPTCAQPGPRPCTRQCILNVCQCKQGYVRSSNGRCVPQESCPSSTPNPSAPCRLNEEFRRCGSACEPTCAQPGPRPCTRQCVLNVCQCKRGYMRSLNGQCVRLAACQLTTTAGPPTKPLRCPHNAFYRIRGPRCYLECTSEKTDHSSYARRRHPAGCYCRRGYISSFKSGQLLACLSYRRCHRTLRRRICA